MKEGNIILDKSKAFALRVFDSTNIFVRRRKNLSFQSRLYGAELALGLMQRKLMQRNQKLTFMLS